MRPLARSLLLGLDQAPLAESQVPLEPGSERPRWRCWLDLGAQAVYLQAGLQARTGQERAAPAPQSALEPMPQELGPVLTLALQNRDPVVLSELQQALTRRRLGVSAGSLPALLSVPEALRELARPMLGEVGHWLAAQRPQWSWALSAPGEMVFDPAALLERFEAGTLSERVEALGRLRELDPSAARALLLASFKTDPAPERLVLIQALETGLSLLDEPMLAGVIESDRSKKVQAQAGELLLRLPRSQHSQRLWEHARPMLSLAGRSLQITLPQAGLSFPGLPTRARPKMGARASHLVEVLSRLPNESWVSELGQPPTKLLQAASPSEDIAAVIGWTLAAERAQDGLWAGPLYRWWRQASLHGHAREALPMLQRLAAVLPLEQRVELAESMLRQSRRADPGVAAAVLQALPTPWPQPVAAAWLRAVAYAQSPRDLAKWLASTIPLASGALPVQMLPQGPLMPGSSAASVFKFSTRVLARRRISSLLG